MQINAVLLIVFASAAATSIVRRDHMHAPDRYVRLGTLNLASERHAAEHRSRGHESQNEKSSRRSRACKPKKAVAGDEPSTLSPILHQSVDVARAMTLQTSSGATRTITTTTTSVTATPGAMLGAHRKGRPNKVNGLIGNNFKTATGSLRAALREVVGQTFKGDATFYTPDLGACYWPNTADQAVVAVGAAFFDRHRTSTAGGAPPMSLCGAEVRATYAGRSVLATVVDRCTACSDGDLDMSRSAFAHLGTEDAGRLHGMTWEFTGKKGQP